MKQNFKKGFTLIELLVVIAIIGILAAITVVSVNGPRNKARDTQSLANLRQVASVLEQYYGDNGNYATSTLSTWPALSGGVAAYGTPLPSSTSPVYGVEVTSTGYCLWADSLNDGGDTDLKIRCKTGAQCGSASIASPSAASCG